MHKKNNKDRNQVAREKVKRKKIVIYGAPINKSTGNSKLILHMAKAFQSAGHMVYTIGLDYNRTQIMYEGVPLLPSFYCERCGPGHKGDDFDVQKMADYINNLQTDYFICVGDPYQFQQHGVGKLSFEKMQHTKAMMYATIDSDGMFCNEQLKQEGKKDYLEICDRVISTAKFTQDMFKKWSDLDTTLIYETIDFNNYVPVSPEKKLEIRKRYRFKEKDFIMYFAGRNTLRKQLFTLIDAAYKLICDTEDTYLFLNVPVGKLDGVKIFPDALNPIDFITRIMKNKFDRNLLEEGRIIFLDREGLGGQSVSERANAELYQLSDVHVTTTRGEGFGLTPVESMACGVPVIVPNNSTGPEIVGSKIEARGKIPDDQSYVLGKGGLLVSAAIDLWTSLGLKQHIPTVEDTYQAMKYMHENTEEREKMGKAGIAHVRQTFDINTFNQKWIKVIDTTIKKVVPQEEDNEFKKLSFDSEGNEEVKKNE